MHKILVIEDERSIAENILYALETENFQVTWKNTGSDAIEEFHTKEFDLLILDIGLPDISGFEVCRKVRETSTVPLFFLTARTEEVDRVLGLELGADDYILKPFSPRELVARVKAMLRRMGDIESGDQHKLVQLGPFGLDESRFQVFFNGQSLSLRRYEFGIVKYLMSRPGWVFSRTQIMNEIWQSPEMSLERTVDTHIKSIRRKIKKYTSDEWIVTHRGIGYSFKEVS